MRPWLLLILGTAILLPACRKEEAPLPSGHYPTLPATPFQYAQLALPAHFLIPGGGPLPAAVTAMDNEPATNRVTDHGATLGRVLFYDTRLSANGQIACASCHRQDQGFSDQAVHSRGFDGGLTRRHSMTLINARYYQRGRFFWDERAATLEQQVLEPFLDPVEMGLTPDGLVQRVRAEAYYAPLFDAAFGSTDITSDRIARALAQFIRSIVSYQSRYDQGRAAAPNHMAPFQNFTPEENQGKLLFFRSIAAGGGGCFGCHTTEAFINAPGGPLNNGLDAVSTTDLGALETFPNQVNLRGAFKTSTLRHIAHTGPYMHDGRFQTLDEVVEHYNSGIQPHPQLAPALRQPNGDPVRLQWTESQKAALVAFLHTLSDPTLAAETKWSDPFK